jgi:hypothetical protein
MRPSEFIKKIDVINKFSLRVDILNKLEEDRRTESEARQKALAKEMRQYFKTEWKWKCSPSHLSTFTHSTDSKNRIETLWGEYLKTLHQSSAINNPSPPPPQK